MTATCVHCHTPLPDGGRFCPTCGADSTDPGAATVRVEADSALRLQGLLTRAIEAKYAVERVLGRGGMGMVFLATDRALDRRVAIKVLPLEYSGDQKLIGRFEAEARTAARLEHRGIVPIYAVESVSGLHFFVMKYVEGRSLQQIIEGGPMPVDLVRQVLAESAEALGHAHKHGVVHRDIKPANIMVQSDGHALLMDFGISKAVQSAVSFTATGQIIGTPQYMSPEQAKGTALDGRADQYSLAVVGYQMLTGKLPFEADSAHAVLYMHISEPPPPIESLRRDAPADLVAVLAKALSKEPAQRFATMEQFASALVPGFTLPTAETVAVTKAKPAPRRRAWWPAAAVVVLVGGAAAFFALRGRQAPAGVPAASPSTAAAPPVVQRADSVAAPAPAKSVAVSPPASTRQREPARRPPAPVQAQAQPSEPAPSTPARAAVGYLTIDADPFGTVNIDGVDVGDTPVVSHALAPGNHTVRITRDGYQTWTRTIAITAGNTESRRVTLVQNP